MTSHRRHLSCEFALAATAAAALLVGTTAGACASARPGDETSRPGAPGAVTTPVSAQIADPHQAAVDEAQRILATFTGPPGSTRVSGEPDGTPAALDHPTMYEDNPDEVDQTAWLVVPGTTPADVLTWAKANPPAGSKPSVSASVGGDSQGMEGFAYTLPSIPATVLAQRQLLVQPAALPGGRTIIRLDAQVDWLPIRPASERVPATATAVTVVETNTMNPTMVTKAQTTPTTTADPAILRQIVALVDGLVPPSPGVRSCPADFGTVATLTFRAGVAGPVVAVVTADPGGCGGVEMTVGGVKQPSLSGGYDLVQQVDKLLGIKTS